MLKMQQEQLNQLSSCLNALQHAPRPTFNKNKQSVICRRCQKPGHFARECDVERVRPPANPAPPVTTTSNQTVLPKPAIGKLLPPELLSQSSGGGPVGSELGAEKPVAMPELMSACPHITALIGGIPVPCLVDTGSMVSTITESSFVQHFAPWGEEKLKSCHWLQLKAANGLEIPYVGYLELDVYCLQKHKRERENMSDTAFLFTSSRLQTNLEDN